MVTKSCKFWLFSVAFYSRGREARRTYILHIIVFNNCISLGWHILTCEAVFACSCKSIIKHKNHGTQLSDGPFNPNLLVYIYCFLIAQHFHFSLLFFLNSILLAVSINSSIPSLPPFFNMLHHNCHIKVLACSSSTCTSNNSFPSSSPESIIIFFL